MGFNLIDGQPEIRVRYHCRIHLRGFAIDVVDGMGGIIPAGLDAPDPDTLNSRFQHDLVQPIMSPPWPLEEVTPRAAIAACLTASTDENGTRLCYREENLALLSSSTRDPKTPDPSLYFLVANTELRLEDRPLKAYLPNWENFRALYNSIDSKMLGLRQTMVSHTKWNRLMVMEPSLLGFVLNSVTVRDVVILLNGHGRPVVASKVLGNDAVVAYRMKGETHVEGMMEDEYIKEMQDLGFV